MKEKNNIALLVVVCSCFSCVLGPKALPSRELVDWYNNPSNGYVTAQEINNIVYEVKRIPLDAKIAGKNHGLSLTTEEYQKGLQELGGLDYYEIKIRHKAGNDILKTGVNSDQEYLSRVDYLSFKAKEDFTLSADGIEKPCQLYHFERSYGLGKHVSISLAFPHAEVEDKALIFNDNVFGAGQLKFRFEQNEGPKLKL